MLFLSAERYICRTKLTIMNPISIAGAFVITLSLLAYGVGSISLSRFRIIATPVLLFLSLGVLLDLMAIVLMIIGAQDTPFTLHGFIGYTAFFIMVADTIMVWRLRIKKGKDAVVGKKHLRFARFAYFCWVLAYLTGSLIILWRK